MRVWGGWVGGCVCVCACACACVRCVYVRGVRACDTPFPVGGRQVVGRIIEDAGLAADESTLRPALKMLVGGAEEQEPAAAAAITFTQQAETLCQVGLPRMQTSM